MEIGGVVYTNTYICNLFAVTKEKRQWKKGRQGYSLIIRGLTLKMRFTHVSLNIDRNLLMYFARACKVVCDFFHCTKFHSIMTIHIFNPTLMH